MAGRRVKSKPHLLLAFLFICISFSSFLPSVLADEGGQLQQQTLRPRVPAVEKKNRPFVLLGGMTRSENGTTTSTGPRVVYLDGKRGPSMGGFATQGARDAIEASMVLDISDTVGQGSDGGSGSGSGMLPLPPLPPLLRPRGTGIAGEFLRAHNEARLKAGIPPLKWDRRLSRYARRWGMKRKADCEMSHSENSPYGENIFWGYSSGWKPSMVVELWVGEQKDYDPQSNSCKAGEICGHYTQVMWKTSQRLGCSKVVCDTGDVFVNCNYDPPGNYQGISPFVGVVL
ncbi:hypothetical protein ACLOJK_010245 [Asimina triloba]